MPYCRRSRSTCSSTVSVDSEDIGDQRNAAEPFEALCTKRPDARVARWKPRNDQLKRMRESLRVPHRCISKQLRCDLEEVIAWA